MSDSRLILNKNKNVTECTIPLKRLKDFIPNVECPHYFQESKSQKFKVER